MSIAKSLRKANYLSLGAEGLAKFLNKMRENQREEEIAKTSADTYKKLKELFAPEPQFEEPQTNSISVLSKEGINQEIPIEEPSIQIMPDYISPQQQMSQSRNLLADYLNKISSIKGVDPERVSKEFSLMQARENLLKPKQKKYEVKQLDPTKRTVKIDEEGNIITVSEPVPEQKQKKATKVGEYVGTDGYKRFVFLNPDGSLQEVRASSRTRYEGGGDNKTKDIGLPSIGDIMNMINYKTDENGNVVQRTPEEIAKYRTVGLNMAKKMLKSDAFNWHNTEILGKWGREDLSFEDYNYEIKQSLLRGEITPEAAEELIAFNSYRTAILGLQDTEPFYKDKLFNNEKKSKGKK